MEDADDWAGGKERGHTDAGREGNDGLTAWPVGVGVVALTKEGRTDTERPCEAWRRGLRLGMLGGSEVLGVRGTGGEETSGGGVARGGKGNGTGNGGGGVTRGIG